MMKWKLRELKCLRAFKCPCWDSNPDCLIPKLALLTPKSVSKQKMHAACCSVVKSCPTLCDPMDCSMSGLSVPHHLPEFAQVHVHWISDVIQPSHPLLPSSSSTFSLSQHQGLFQWVSCSHQVSKVLELELQHQSVQWIQGWFPLGLTGLISLQSKDSQESSPTPQFKSINSLAFSFQLVEVQG